MLFLQHVALNCSVVVSLIKDTKIQQTRDELVAEQWNFHYSFVSRKDCQSV